MNERYSQLKYKVHLTDKALDVAFPALFRSPEMKRLKFIKNWSKVVKYIVFMYSKETGLIPEFPSELKARKEAAAIDAGFERDLVGAFPQDIQEIMDIQNKDVTAAILAYLKHQSHMVWMEIQVTEQELFDFQKLRFMTIDTGTKKLKKKKGEEVEVNDLNSPSEKDIYDAARKKDELLEACEKRIKYLESLYNQFYGDSKKELMESEFTEMITPENAERLMQDQMWDDKAEMHVSPN